MRSGEIEIATRGRQNCFLLLRAETVASCFRQLVSFERFENRVADVGLGENRSTRGVTLFMDFFDYALGVLDQVVVPAIGDPRRNPRKKTFDCALLCRIRLGQFFARELDVDVACTGEAQRRCQINRQKLRRSI